MNKSIARWCLLSGLALACAWAQATLPPPAPLSPDAAAAAAAKKAAADAQAQHDKEALAASMDGVSKRWRANAAKQGWKTHPAVAVVAPPTAPAAAPAPAK